MAAADVEDPLSTIMNRKRNEMDSTPLPHIIRRIPPVLRNPDPGAFEPKIVSIGPLHRGKEELKAMEESKWRFFDALIRRSHQNTADKYVKAARSLEERARQCYSDDQVIHPPLDPDAFVEMMVLDGCFILEYLIKTFLFEESNAIPNARTMRSDLLLLENQIPFFVLQSFFDISHLPQLLENTDRDRLLWLSRIGIRVDPITLTKLAICFVTIGRASEVTTNPNAIHHLFHLFYLSLCPGERAPCRRQATSWKRKLAKCMRRIFFHPFLWFLSLFLHNPRRLSRRYSYAWRKLHSATELREAGVRFYPKGRDGLLDITFSWDDGALEIPPLPVSSATYPGLRNLSVFEILYQLPGRFINSYLLLWRLLIKTPEDVALLQESGVLGNAFGKREEVAVLLNFNETSYASFERNYYMPVIQQMQMYCRDETRSWVMSLMNDYFSNPWTMISVITAILVLLLSLLHTVLSVYRFVHPRHG